MKMYWVHKCVKKCLKEFKVLDVVKFGPHCTAPGWSNIVTSLAQDLSYVHV